MLREVPTAKRFVAVVLNDNGAQAFPFLEGARAGDRQVYFIDRVAKGARSEAWMLLGQLLVEFEKLPEDALRLSPGATNRLYFPARGHNGDNLPGDRRVSWYDDLTPEEAEETWKRLSALAERHPKAAELLQYLQ